MTKESLFTRVFHENENQPLHVENSWLKREKKAGKADHVVASNLRAWTKKATNLIFDLILTLKTQRKFFFFSNTHQHSRNSNQASYLSSTFLPPSPTEISDAFCGYGETYGKYAMQKGCFTAACYSQSPRLVTHCYLHFNSEN